MSRESELELLAAGARDIGIAADPQSVAALLRLVDELELGNAQFNLTAIRDRPGMLHKHVLDSLSLQPYLRGNRVADIGTGAGFPGLPLAIVNPQRRFTLVEATGKKARFVAQTAQTLRVRAMFTSSMPARKTIGRSNFSIQWWRGLCRRWPISPPTPGICALRTGGCWR